MKVRELITILNAITKLEPDVNDYEVVYTIHNAQGDFVDFAEVDTTGIDKKNKNIILSDIIF